MSLVLLLRQMQEELYEFEASLVHMMSSRSARTTEDSILKQIKQQQQKHLDGEDIQGFQNPLPMDRKDWEIRFY